MAELVPVAAAEDDPIIWYRRNGVRRRDAVKAAALDWGGRMWQLIATPVWLCESDDDEESWFSEVDHFHLEAFAAWRVEPRVVAPAWWWKVRRHLRKLHPAGRARRPVLWGGRLGRYTNWADRLLLGRGHVVITGDRWFWLHESELCYCDVCEATTPHTIHPTPLGLRLLCAADGHFDRVRRQVR